MFPAFFAPLYDAFETLVSHAALSRDADERVQWLHDNWRRLLTQVLSPSRFTLSRVLEN